MTPRVLTILSGAQYLETEGERALYALLSEDRREPEYRPPRRRWIPSEWEGK